MATTRRSRTATPPARRPCSAPSTRGGAPSRPAGRRGGGGIAVAVGRGGRRRLGVGPAGGPLRRAAAAGPDHLRRDRRGHQQPARPGPGAARHRPRSARSLLYQAVKEVDPDNVEATTYSGWLLAIQAATPGNPDLVVQAEGLLDDAIAARSAASRRPLLQGGRPVPVPRTTRPRRASALDRCTALDPPAEVAVAAPRACRPRSTPPWPARHRHRRPPTLPPPAD